jgi:hypothetical protein
MSYHGWTPDFRSLVVGILIMPVFAALLFIVAKYIRKWSRFLADGILSLVGRFIMHELASALTLKRYCKLQLAGTSKFLHVPSSGDVQVEVDRVYVTLLLEGAGTGQTSFSHADIYKAGNRIRVVGDPGSGKSSLVKRLFRDACSSAVERPRKGRLPILVELRNLEVDDGVEDKGLGDWFLRELRSRAELSKVYEMGECFDACAGTEGLLVLLDGLDEVSSSAYPRVSEAIRGLGDKLYHLGEKNVAILTMRSQFHQQIRDDYRDAFPRVLSLRPFSPSDIYEFLTRRPFDSGSQQSVSRIYKNLTDRPTLREMCSNPLVLSNYVAEDQSSVQAVPHETRTEFYKKVAEELIIKRRLKQTGRGKAPTKRREQRERILGRLALEHLLDPNQPANLLSWADALRVVGDVLSCDQQAAASRFREIAKDTGLVSEEREGETFRFIHLTLCEFLAAFEAVQGREAGWSELISAHGKFVGSGQAQARSRLAEVIPFACGLLPRVKRSGAVDDVSVLPDAHTLALSFLETKQYDHPSWPLFVDSEQSALLETPEERWDGAWLRRLHLFNVIVRDANECGSYMPTAGGTIDLPAFFRTLASKQKDSLGKVLSSYASQDAAAAFRLAEVCNLDLPVDFQELVISNCDQPPFFALVKEQALRDTHRINLWAELLCEAALESRLVAKWLADIEPSADLGGAISELKPEGRWFQRLSLKPSLYSQLFSIALGVPAPRTDSTKLLNLARLLPPPKRFMVWYFTAVALLLASILALIPVVPLVDRTNSPGLNLLGVAAFLLAGALIAASTYFLMRGWFNRLGYRQILQMGDDLVSIPVSVGFAGLLLSLATVVPRSGVLVLFEIILGSVPRSRGSYIREGAFLPKRYAVHAREIFRQRP